MTRRVPVATPLGLILTLPGYAVAGSTASAGGAYSRFAQPLDRRRIQGASPTDPDKEKQEGTSRLRAVPGSRSFDRW